MKKLRKLGHLDKIKGQGHLLKETTKGSGQGQGTKGEVDQDHHEIGGEVGQDRETGGGTEIEGMGIEIGEIQIEIGEIGESLTEIGGNQKETGEMIEGQGQGNMSKRQFENILNVKVKM